MDDGLTAQSCFVSKETTDGTVTFGPTKYNNFGTIERIKL